MQAKTRRLLYSKMKKADLLEKALGLAEVAEAQREWIDSVPSETPLPVMPGFSRDWADEVMDD